MGVFIMTPTCKKLDRSDFRFFWWWFNVVLCAGLFIQVCIIQILLFRNLRQADRWRSNLPPVSLPANRACKIAHILRAIAATTHAALLCIAWIMSKYFLKHACVLKKKGLGFRDLVILDCIWHLACSSMQKLSILPNIECESFSFQSCASSCAESHQSLQHASKNKHLKHAEFCSQRFQHFVSALWLWLWFWLQPWIQFKICSKHA